MLQILRWPRRLPRLQHSVSIVLFLLGLFSQQVLAIAVANNVDARSTFPAPISVTPSQDWDGNDGPWSSFAVQIGTPPQLVKLLISTAASQTWAVATEGCGPGDPTNCAQLRGGQYDYTASSTYVPNLANASTQIYFLTLESNLGYEGNGRYGFDDITLGFQGGGEAKLNNQTIAGIATKDDGTSVPSFMQNLRNQDKIPSISWGYTAGNQYRLGGTLGSLTLGGYDASKFISNDLSMPFSPDVDKDLTIQIDSISSDTTGSLLTSPIMAFLDSTIPYLYLPTSACLLFESAFGLIWDEIAQLYLVNTTQHVLLQTQNPNVTFTIGSNYTSAKVNIILPYAAFDLTASYPLVNDTAHYFPLKRINDSTQYTLGRTFFQEAYVIADYERKNFTVSPCKWVPESPNIVAILPPPNSTLGQSSRPTSLPLSATIGIGVGGATIILVTVLSLYLWWLRRERKGKPFEAVTHTLRTQEFNKPELDGGLAGHLYGAAIFGTKRGSKVVQIAEIGAGSPRQVFEMPAREDVAAEMTGQTKPSELSSRELRWSWIRGDSRASRFGGRGARSPRGLNSAGTGAMSSLSSGMGSLGDKIARLEVLVAPPSLENMRWEMKGKSDGTS